MEHVYVEFGILAPPVFDISCGKTNKQMHKHTNAAEHPTHSTTTGAGNENDNTNIYISTPSVVRLSCC